MSLIKNYYFILPLLTLPPAGQAAPPKPAPLPEPERQFDIASPHTAPTPPTPSAPPSPEKGAVSMSQEELLANPELLQQALDSALTVDNIEGIRLLLPLYQQLPQTDPILLDYAQAVVARSDGHLSIAITHFRQIIATRPDLTPMRLQLAMALFDNHEDVAAADQFEKIRAQQDLPPEIDKIVKQYLSALQQRLSWSFSAGVQYLQDSNINNAPLNRQFGNYLFDEAQAAHGIGYQINITRTFPWKNGWGAQVMLDADGKTYWDNHRYNELTSRAYGGATFRDLRNEVSLLPFYERKWYSGEAYSHGPGIRIQASRWLHPRWQALGTFEYGRKIQQQPKYRYLDGNSYLLSTTALYLASPKQYWLAGLDLGRETARAADSTYTRVGVRGGWGQEWRKGISTLVTAGIARRHYADQSWGSTEMRRDTEYFATASVWLRNLHFYGLTPRLSVAWQRYASNHPLYNYQKTRIFMEISKKF